LGNFETGPQTLGRFWDSAGEVTSIGVTGNHLETIGESLDLLLRTFRVEKIVPDDDGQLLSTELSEKRRPMTKAERVKMTYASMPPI